MKDWARNRNVKRRARDGWKWSRVLDGGVPNGTDGRADRGAWSGVPNGADGRADRGAWSRVLNGTDGRADRGAWRG